jgi:hypothetical protein
MRVTVAALVAAAAALVGVLGVTERSARAQACCAGSGAVTPGRLALHETVLVGTSLKAGLVTGSYDGDAHYHPLPSGASEQDFEQDVFGAVRVLDRGQLAVLVPFVETRRTASGTTGAGGGIGDVNFAARYDFTLAGASRVVPGIAALGGLTVPSGRPADSPSAGTLATGATGIGAYQINVGLALEQTFGPWLVGVSGIYAQRTARTVGEGASLVHERLAPQWTALAVAAYVFPSEVALAASASYTVEGDATIGGVGDDESARRLPVLSLSAVVPLSDKLRLQGALFDDLPLSTLGTGQPAAAGLTFTLIYSWI